jgi:hypothetical protein
VGEALPNTSTGRHLVPGQCRLFRAGNVVRVRLRRRLYEIIRRDWSAGVVTGAGRVWRVATSALGVARDARGKSAPASPTRRRHRRQSARCRRSSAELWSDTGRCDARVHARTIRVEDAVAWHRRRTLRSHPPLGWGRGGVFTTNTAAGPFAFEFLQHRFLDFRAVFYALTVAPLGANGTRKVCTK